jgi:hypothetical protein
MTQLSAFLFLVAFMLSKSAMDLDDTMKMVVRLSAAYFFLVCAIESALWKAYTNAKRAAKLSHFIK